VTQCGLILLVGQLLTVIKAKHVLLGAIFFFELGSLICAVAKSMPILIFGRAVQGIGKFSLSSDLVSLRNRCVWNVRLHPRCDRRHHPSRSTSWLHVCFWVSPPYIILSTVVANRQYCLRDFVGDWTASWRCLYRASQLEMVLLDQSSLWSRCCCR
jgi:hypothetical protein